MAKKNQRRVINTGLIRLWLKNERIKKIEIAKSAGVTPTAAYRYFAGQLGSEKLTEALLARGCPSDYFTTPYTTGPRRVLNPVELRVWLLRRELTQADLAREIGVTRQCVFLTINGQGYSKRVVEALRLKGCPEELL